MYTEPDDIVATLFCSMRVTWVCHVKRKEYDTTVKKNWKTRTLYSLILSGKTKVKMG